MNLLNSHNVHWDMWDQINEHASVNMFLQIQRYLRNVFVVVYCCSALVRGWEVWTPGVEQLLLYIELSCLRSFKYLIRMPPGQLPLEVFWACQLRRDPRVYQELADGIIYLIWPGGALQCPSRRWKLLFWRSLEYLAQSAAAGSWPQKRWRMQTVVVDRRLDGYLNQFTNNTNKKTSRQTWSWPLPQPEAKFC